MVLQHHFQALFTEDLDVVKENVYFLSFCGFSVHNNTSSVVQALVSVSLDAGFKRKRQARMNCATEARFYLLLTDFAMYKGHRYSFLRRGWSVFLLFSVNFLLPAFMLWAFANFSNKNP